MQPYPKNPPKKQDMQGLLGRPLSALICKNVDFPNTNIHHWGTWNIWSSVDVHSSHSPVESEQQKPSELPRERASEREREETSSSQPTPGWNVSLQHLHKHSLSLSLSGLIFTVECTKAVFGGFCGSKRRVNGCRSESVGIQHLHNS